MNDWFEMMAATCELQPDAAEQLHHQGFTVIPEVVPRDSIEQLVEAYDTAVSVAADVRFGSTSTRVNDFVNRGRQFDDLYLFPPLLKACCQIIQRPFKLSSFHARTIHPRSRSGELHTDVLHDSVDWPLVSFILMVDDFRPDNGATRFVPESHHRPGGPLPDRRVEHDNEVLACGAAGSLLIFNGSVWHDHSANKSGRPRRSLQGAFIPREGRAGTDFAVRMQPETRARLTPVAQYLLAI